MSYNGKRPGSSREPSLENRHHGYRDGCKSNRFRHGAQHRSLAALVAAADAMGLARRAVHVARCPYCRKLLVLPEHPVAVVLPQVLGGSS
jgi:hypothetical protein